MKQSHVIEPIAGKGIIYNCTVEHSPSLRGEFDQVGPAPVLNYRQIRFAIRRASEHDKMVTIMIRPDTPGGTLVFDIERLLSKSMGFILHSIRATDDIGNFVLKGQDDFGPFEIPISTNPEGMNFRPMPGLLITEVRLPLAENDWSRD